MTRKTPLQIFIEAGINVNILGREQPQRYLSRWNKIHRIYGVVKHLQNLLKK